MLKKLGSVLKLAAQAILFLGVVPLLLATPWTLLLMILSQKFHWKGFALINGFVAIVYWVELAKERGLVFEAAMSTFVWVILSVVIAGIVVYVRAH